MKLQNIDKNLLGIYEKAINNKFNLEKKIIIAKKAGFDFIELSIDETNEKLNRLNWTTKTTNKIRMLLIKHNFYFNSLCLSAHRLYPFGSKDYATRKRARIIIKKAILLAKKLGIRIIQLATYDTYYEKSDSITKTYFLKGINYALTLAKKHSFMLAFESMDTIYGSSIVRLLNIINHFNSPYLMIYPDIGNLSQFCNDIDQQLILAKDKIVGIHFKNTLPNQFKNVEWESGNVNFPRILKTLKMINYNGPILLEMWSKNDINETMEENINLLINAKNFYLKQWELSYA